LRELMARENPVFETQGVLGPRGCGNVAGPAGVGEVSDAAFVPAISDYYLTNVIARASATMAECSRTYVHPPVALAAE